MNRTLYFVIPASPTASFFSQIAMFELAVRRRTWRLFTPQVIAVFGDTPNDETYDKWRPHVQSVIKVFLPSDQSTRGGYMRQVDWRFRVVPTDADIAIFCDADTIVVGDVEEMASMVAAEQSVAGVIAHYHFPGSSPLSPQCQWDTISESLIGRAMTFSFQYTLSPTQSPPEQRKAPFYLNFGAVFVAGAILERLARRYLDLRTNVSDITNGSYMSAQIALALAVEAEQVPRRALGMAYNFPNDPIADEMYPEELADVRVLHFLRQQHVQRAKIFTTPCEFAQFLELPLEGSNRGLQSFVRDMTSGIYPFTGIS